MNPSFDPRLTPFEPGDPLYYQPPRPRTRVWLHVSLLALTFVTTTLMGGFHYLSFGLGFDVQPGALPDLSQLLSAPSFYLNGLFYSLTILAILGCHEMGHYVACRLYRVDATLPYFLPAPPPILTGTFGAVIRIRARIPSKLALFDIGIAGPIAGFVVAVPALVVGLALSRIERVPEDFQGYSLGEPLLFQAVAHLLYGNVTDGMSINLHPMGLAAWFGLIVTALNLFPIGQLDGGHIAYAVFGRKAVFVTIGTALMAIVLTIFSTSYLLFTLLAIAALFLFGPQHPPTLNDDAPLGTGRFLLALFALAMLILCFTPTPIELFVSQ